MITSFWADAKPRAPAVFDRFGYRTFADVNANANRIVRLLRANGVRAGQHIALLSSNRAEVMEIMSAALRGGYRLVPINWHFTETEVAYVLENSDAAAFFVESKFPAALAAARRVSGLKATFVIGSNDDGRGLAEAVSEFSGDDITDPHLGTTMLYTSGTTGRPKGVYRAKIGLLAERAVSLYEPDNDVQLCAGPTYHGAPLTLEVRTAMTAGVPVVFLDRWDTLEVLQTIEARHVTHAHLVPVMFQRLLALPSHVRGAFNVSSLKRIEHGAAPCPPEVKRAMIDWFGPILHEYYAGTEGSVGFATDSHEWLRKPGSVGRRPAGAGVCILDASGAECPPNTAGRIFFQSEESTRFSYYNDADKTRETYVGDYYTLGDVGFFDDDDYLFLTGRSAECIISGGVNIYPQEIDNELITHPAVEDAASVGVPNAEWGEEVKAVIQLRAGWTASPELAAQILSHLRGTLAGFKVPRSVDFVDHLPRNAAGKVERTTIRASYWQDRDRQI